MKHSTLLRLLLLFFVVAAPITAAAQELNAKVTVNTSKISNTKKEVFDALREKVQAFLNDHKWTQMQEPREVEKIACNFSITVNKWDESTNQIEAELLLTSLRPVFGSSYTTNLYSLRDGDFAFSFQTTDQLEWNPDNISENLPAMLAYYAYMIIGYDMDSMAPLGGTPYFRTAEDIVTNCQSLGAAGWSQLNDPKNRAGLLNDYMDGAMEPYRNLIYKYHRQGLDQMATNAEAGRKAVAESLELLDQCKNARTMSQLPTLFTEIKREEIVNLFQGKGTREERDRVYNIFFSINPSLNEQWTKLKN